MVSHGDCIDSNMLEEFGTGLFELTDSPFHPAEDCTPPGFDKPMRNGETMSVRETPTAAVSNEARRHVWEQQGRVVRQGHSLETVPDRYPEQPHAAYSSMRTNTTNESARMSDSKLPLPFQQQMGFLEDKKPPATQQLQGQQHDEDHWANPNIPLKFKEVIPPVAARPIRATRQRKPPPVHYESQDIGAQGPAVESCPKIAAKRRHRTRQTQGNWKRKQSTNLPVDAVFINDEPTDDDVLMGRGGRSNHHPGNKRYHDVMESMKPRYRAATKDNKPHISQELVQTVKNWGGRFLKKEDNGDRWYEVPNPVARKKAAQALREDNTPEVRKKRRERYGK